LVRITPEPEPDQPGKLTVHNACLSGGSLEVFLEPVLPSPVLAVIGDSPIARALVALGRPLGYDVVPYESSAMSSVAAPTAVVVASHGRGEEEALTAALRSGVRYVALVASRKRAEAVLASLEVTEEERARVHSPAGLDIGARTPAEIALSVLAELVMERPRPSARPVGEPAADAADVTDTNHRWVTSEAATAADPVCGMTVVTDEASLHLDHEGVRYWFCGSGCLRAFASEPAAYTAVGSP
jgi:xanthine dehydrogenase accessory factor